MRFFVLPFLAIWFLGFGFFEHAIQKPSNEPKGPFDLIVVLTGGHGRISEGFEKLREDPQAKLLISGVISKSYLKMVNRRQRADVKDRVILGVESDNTHENILEIRKIAKDLKAKRLLMMTSDYHMPRTTMLAGRLLKDVDLTFFKIPNKHRLRFEKHENLFTEFLEYNKFLVLSVNTSIRKLMP